MVSYKSKVQVVSTEGDLSGVSCGVESDEFREECCFPVNPDVVAVVPDEVWSFSLVVYPSRFFVEVVFSYCVVLCVAGEDVVVFCCL